MGPGGRLCGFGDASQDGDRAGVAEVAHSCRHEVLNAGPHHRPQNVFAVSNPAMEEEENGSGWST